MRSSSSTRNTGDQHAIESRFSLALSYLPLQAPMLAAISGGRDSVALLHLLLTSGRPLPTVCHLNHDLRGKASEEDVVFVEKLARQLKMRVICEKIVWTKPQKTSLEAAARQARLAFFARTAQQTGIHDILLGHHADDQAETFLWNLLRGSGRDGLAAMQPMTEMTVDGTILRLHRPLLGLWREEIDRYVSTRQLDWREDASNQSTDFTRNLLRHEIIPWLEKKLGRNIRSPLWRAAEIVRAENAWLDDLTGEFPSPAPLLVTELAGKALAWQRRRIQAWLVANSVPETDFAHVEAVRSLLKVENGPARINLPANLQARRRTGRISLVQLQPPDA